MDWLEKRWLAHAAALEVRPELQRLGWLMLTAMYAGRAYHNINHVGDCLADLTLLNDRTKVPNIQLVEAALWWHDAAYDVKADPGANEEHSSTLAVMFYADAGLRPTFYRACVIRDTCHEARNPSRGRLCGAVGGRS